MSEEEVKRRLQQMDPLEFEKLVAEVWESDGYKTTVTKGSGDRGIDIEATKDMPVSRKELIQVKNYSGKNKISSKEVRKYATLYQQETNVDEVTIVTSSDITSQASELASDLEVKILDGDSLAGTVAEITSELSFSLNQSDEITSSSTSTSSTTSTYRYNHYWDKCPICGSHDVLEPMRNRGQRRFACDGCNAEWVRESRGDTTGWRGTSGEVEGKWGTPDEWRHYDSRDLSPDPPYTVQESVYNNRAWKLCKLSVGISVGLLAFLMLVGAGYGMFTITVIESSTLSSNSIFTTVVLGWYVSVIIAIISFSVYASKDKQILDDATGQAVTHSPITIGLLVLFTGLLYPLFYSLLRQFRYKIEEQSEDESG